MRINKLVEYDIFYKILPVGGFYTSKMFLSLIPQISKRP